MQVAVMNPSRFSVPVTSSPRLCKCAKTMLSGGVVLPSNAVPRHSQPLSVAVPLPSPSLISTHVIPVSFFLSTPLMHFPSHSRGHCRCSSNHTHTQHHSSILPSSPVHRTPNLRSHTSLPVDSEPLPDPLPADRTVHRISRPRTIVLVIWNELVRAPAAHDHVAAGQSGRVGELGVADLALERDGKRAFLEGRGARGRVETNWAGGQVKTNCAGELVETNWVEGVVETNWAERRVGTVWAEGVVGPIFSIAPVVEVNALCAPLAQV
ncbi:hypothetical protein BJ546DRAFT_480027 [Cryomyces antarcticus]